MHVGPITNEGKAGPAKNKNKKKVSEIIFLTLKSTKLLSFSLVNKVFGNSFLHPFIPHSSLQLLSLYRNFKNIRCRDIYTKKSPMTASVFVLLWKFFYIIYILLFIK
eukprot:Phypoly_transcript_26888.p1 GENE.Phypoly_transcript_26888~~Phypoly_transcript_26888.p1  ORF type:complete len:107 (-),score=6.72 Phypoly_transcript_26888:8-328(-)